MIISRLAYPRPSCDGSSDFHRVTCAGSTRPVSIKKIKENSETCHKPNCPLIPQISTTPRTLPTELNGIWNLQCRKQVQSRLVRSMREPCPFLTMLKLGTDCPTIAESLSWI